MRVKIRPVGSTGLFAVVAVPQTLEALIARAAQIFGIATPIKDLKLFLHGSYVSDVAALENLDEIEIGIFPETQQDIIMPTTSIESPSNIKSTDKVDQTQNLIQASKNEINDGDPSTDSTTSKATSIQKKKDRKRSHDAVMKTDETTAAPKPKRRRTASNGSKNSDDKSYEYPSTETTISKTELLPKPPVRCQSHRKFPIFQQQF